MIHFSEKKQMGMGKKEIGLSRKLKQIQEMEKLSKIQQLYIANDIGIIPV